MSYEYDLDYYKQNLPYSQRLIWIETWISQNEANGEAFVDIAKQFFQHTRICRVCSFFFFVN